MEKRSATSHLPILTMELKYEHDVVLIRQRARQLAGLLGFDGQEQTRIATSVSEIARNAFQYAGGGRAEFQLTQTGSKVSFEIRLTDRGKGIAQLEAILGGLYVSKTGMGLGIIGARRLMDDVNIETSGDGTIVTLRKTIPNRKSNFGTKDITAILDELARNAPQSPYEEVQTQNQELLKTMAVLREKQLELGELNRELEDTNRGVVALYAELDEKAESLRKANEAKTGFLSNMTHEFRSPLNSILNITQLLLDHSDGELNAEQDKQVRFIRKAATSLSDLVNDLLDLAKVEAGKIAVRPTEFNCTELLSTLRGLMRPLAMQNPQVSLVFEEPAEALVLFTDEGKLAQVIRNFISNALKYTEKGEVRVSVASAGPQLLCFTVQDTGIGISSADQHRIFEEFTQVDSALQRRVEGTGLGLPLALKLTRLLGGTLDLQSEVGHGSKFSIVIPARYSGPQEGAYLEQGDSQLSLSVGLTRLTTVQRIVVVDDDESMRYFVSSVARDLGAEVATASDGQQGLELIQSTRPDLVILDLVMPKLQGMGVLEAMMSESTARDIPVIIHTSKELDAQEREYLSQVTVRVLPKSGLTSELLKQTILLGLNRDGASSAIGVSHV